MDYQTRDAFAWEPGDVVHLKRASIEGYCDAFIHGS